MPHRDGAGAGILLCFLFSRIPPCQCPTDMQGTELEPAFPILPARQYPPTLLRVRQGEIRQ